MGRLAVLIWEPFCFQLQGRRLELFSPTWMGLLIFMAFKVTQSLYLAPKLLEKVKLCIGISFGA